jgi:hypothetical protein
MTNENAIAINATANLLKIAKSSLARYQTLLKQEEAKMEAMRAEIQQGGNPSPSLMIQSSWLIERREKSIARWKLDVAELEARLAKMTSSQK